MSQGSQCSLPLSQESYQTLVFLNQQEGANLFPQQNQLFRSSVTSPEHDGTMGTSEILITRVNMQPAAAYAAWHAQPMSPGQTPVSPNSDVGSHHSQPPTPCLTPRSLPNQSSVFQYPNPVTDNTPTPQMLPTVPHLHHPRIKPEPDIDEAVHVSTANCMIPHQPIYAADVPNNLPMPGNYEFDLYFLEERKDIPKSALLTYSDALKRLFIKQNQKIPLNFKIIGSLPLDCYIRAMTIFKTPGMIREIVTTCPKHSADMQSQSLSHPEHFSRSENDGAIYQKDVNGRLSVLVPFKSLQANQGYYTALFKFPCFSSCLPKDSYHLAQVVFTLEYRNELLGRCCVDIRVCASPGRDRKVAEEAADTPTTVKKWKRKGNDGGQSIELQPCPIPPKKAAAGNHVTPPSEEDKTMPSKKKKYCIETDNKEVYHVLMTLKNTIEPFYNSNTRNNASATSPIDSGIYSQGSFKYVDKWLEHIKMKQYKTVFTRSGVTDMFQLESLSDKEVRDILKNVNRSDREKLHYEIDRYKTEQARLEDMASTQYSSSSQGTQYSSSSSQGDSQFGSQPPLEYQNAYPPPLKNNSRTSSSSSQHSEAKSGFQDAILLQLRRTFFNC